MRKHQYVERFPVEDSALEPSRFRCAVCGDYTNFKAEALTKLRGNYAYCEKGRRSTWKESLRGIFNCMTEISINAG